MEKEIKYKNEGISLFLASYCISGAQKGIHLSIDMRLPGKLPIASTALCSLLGSALDNAFEAAQAVEYDSYVHITAKLWKGKLLIQVQNPYVGETRIENGLPRNKHGLRGFGVKNMEAIVEKHGGLSSYEAVDGLFTVRFVF